MVLIHNKYSFNSVAISKLVLNFTLHVFAIIVCLLVDDIYQMFLIKNECR